MSKTMMLRILVLFFLLLLYQFSFAQKKPLDHTVYDGWQSVGKNVISNDGKWIAYTIELQEGDAGLVVRSLIPGSPYVKTIERGTDPVITQDNRYMVFRIRPFYQQLKEARIKKKKIHEYPKDTLGIIELGKQEFLKWGDVKGYKLPEKGHGWIAFQLREPAIKKISTEELDKIRDSLLSVVDSLQSIIRSRQGTRKGRKKDEEDSFISMYNAESSGYDEFKMTDSSRADSDSIADLHVRNLTNGQETIFKNVAEYFFSSNGRKLLVETGCGNKDTNCKKTVILFDLLKGFGDTLSRGGNDFRNFTMTRDGLQAAYVAERDQKPGGLYKFYKLWYFKEGMDSAIALVEKTSVGMQIGLTVSENAKLEFSKSGKRLLFGTAPIEPAQDTTLISAELPELDIWHYKDDFLQTVQLVRREQNLKQSFLAVFDFEEKKIEQLGSPDIPFVIPTQEGDGNFFVGISDIGKRIESQWTNQLVRDIYVIGLKAGSAKLVKKDFLGVMDSAYLSPSGKFILWYDYKTQDYFSYDGDSIRNISARIKVPLYNEEFDSPSDPPPYGMMGWLEDEKKVFVYDKYGIWQLDPANKTPPAYLVDGRKNNVQYRYISTDPEQRMIRKDQPLVFSSFNKKNRQAGLWEYHGSDDQNKMLAVCPDADLRIERVSKAKEADVYLYTKETYRNPPDLYVGFTRGSASDHGAQQQVDRAVSVYQEEKLTSLNPQQQNYFWGTAELYRWKTFKGKQAEGILYKPENFSPFKKYPLLLYFYERLSDRLHYYIPPAPSAASLNISFFVSRGYLVLAPDIVYTTGHPAQSTYDYVVSAAKDLSRQNWVDANRMGIQGQSWGGLQVAQLITMTNLFKAAWAGAPVSNMTSAYGGIRWGTGLSRQFQYERMQSRIGASLWEKPELYLENSPLFHLPKVKTPLVLVANDKDEAVPWYQGIELFTAMRRLGKKVWMLNYNGETHNLTQRKNRKDLQVRQQQFFDWLLMDARPAKWITEGVPATRKGKDWGLEPDD